MYICNYRYWYMSYVWFVYVFFYFKFQGISVELIKKRFRLSIKKLRGIILYVM